MLTLHWSNLLNLLPDSIIAIVLIVMAVPFLIYGMAVAARNYLSAMKSIYLKGKGMLQRLLFSI